MIVDDSACLLLWCQHKCRNEEVSQLLPWMQSERPNIYKHMGGSRYFCMSCGHQVYFVRCSLSARSFVAEHEKTAKRQQGLKLLGHSSLHLARASSSTVPEASILYSPMSFRIILQVLVSSFHVLYLQFVSEATPGTGSLATFNVSTVHERLVLRHARCQKSICEHGQCTDCRSLPGHAAWIRPTSSSCVLKRTEVRNFLEKMSAKDYVLVSKKNGAEVARCIELHGKLGIRALHDHCYRKFMERHIYGLELLDVSTDEQAAYEALCASMEQTHCGGGCPDRRHAARLLGRGRKPPEACRRQCPREDVCAQRAAAGAWLHFDGCLRLGTHM